jgi:NADH:ubiquinone oxidoreductase subunit H
MGAISSLFVIIYFGGWSNFFYTKKNYIEFFDYIDFFNDSKWNYFYFNIFNTINFLKFSNPFIESFTSAIKIVFVCMLFIFIRAALPRKRFDQLIQLCWKYFFMVSLSFVIFYISIFTYYIQNYDFTKLY